LEAVPKAYHGLGRKSLETLGRRQLVALELRPIKGLVRTVIESKNDYFLEKVATEAIDKPPNGTDSRCVVGY
jgi:hypothetical protein